MNYLSLFSGIGGLDLGLDRAGMTCVGQVERDPYCRRVLARHWPEVSQHDDVRTTIEWWLGTTRPAVHLVAGGPPCQGHSVAGDQLGAFDPRWGWPWFRDVATAVGAPWILVENVPNLVRTGLRDILIDLADLGFDAWWGRIPAAAVGAPHLRWRQFLIAAHADRVQLRHEPGWGFWADRSGPTVAGHDGSTWAVAHPDTGRPQPAHSRWWAAEPDVGRVANGVPERVDRIRALGNAVVPAVAERVGRLIMQAAQIEA